MMDTTQLKTLFCACLVLSMLLHVGMAAAWLQNFRQEDTETTPEIPLQVTMRFVESPGAASEEESEASAPAPPPESEPVPEPEPISEPEPVPIPEPEPEPEPEPIPEPEPTPVQETPESPTQASDTLLADASLSAPQDNSPSVEPSPVTTLDVASDTESETPEDADAEHAEVDLGAYTQDIFRQIASARTYPRAAERMRAEGHVVVAFTIQPDGEVTNLSIRDSSGYRVLDDAAEQLMQRVSPLPRPPYGPFDATFTISYTL